MFTSQMTALALAGVMAFGNVGGTVGTALPVTFTTQERPAISIEFNKEEKAAELAEKAATMEAMALEFAEKGLAFEQAKAGMESKLLESGKSQEEIDALLEQFTAKFDELKAEKGEEVAVKQAEREANVAAREEKGVVKGSKSAGEIV